MSLGGLKLACRGTFISAAGLSPVWAIPCLEGWHCWAVALRNQSMRCPGPSHSRPSISPSLSLQDNHAFWTFAGDQRRLQRVQRASKEVRKLCNTCSKCCQLRSVLQLSLWRYATADSANACKTDLEWGWHPFLGLRPMRPPIVQQYNPTKPIHQLIASSPSSWKYALWI